MLYRTLNFYQAINEIRKCNPNVDIIVGDFVYDEKAMKRIYSSVNIDELILPAGFYLDSNNHICNKSNFMNYIDVEVKDIDDIENILTTCPIVHEDVLDINTTELREIAIAIQKLNPRITVKLANKLYYEEADYTIFTNVPIQQLALPRRYYMTMGNRITNKYNSDNATYVSIKIEDIKKADPFYLIETGYDIDSDKQEIYKVKQLKKINGV